MASSAVDLAHLARYTGGDEALNAEVLRLFDNQASELVERLHVEIEDGEFETVGGYVLSRVGRVPAVGERFTFDGLEVEVLEAERRRIHKVRLRRAAEPAMEASE